MKAAERQAPSVRPCSLAHHRMITPPSAELMVLAEAVRILRFCKSKSPFQAGFCLSLLKKCRSQGVQYCGRPVLLPNGSVVLGRMLALGLADGRVMLVDEATGEVKWDVQAHPGTGGGRAYVSMSPDNGRFVASVGMDEKHWKLWDAASGAVHRVGARRKGCVHLQSDENRSHLSEGRMPGSRAHNGRATGGGILAVRSKACNGSLRRRGDRVGRSIRGCGTPLAGRRRWTMLVCVVLGKPSTLDPHPPSINPRPLTLNPQP